MGRVARWIRALAGGGESCLYTFRLDGVGLLRQLLFEEFLYRRVAPVAERSAFFLVNNHRRTGSKAVVMGLSGKADQFVRDPAGTRSRGIQLIRRFTGGGTVIVDECSLNTSFIASTQLAHGMSPTQICNWVYDHVFRDCGIFNGRFGVVEGDFVVRPRAVSDISGHCAVASSTADPGCRQGACSDGGHSLHKVAGNSQAFNPKAYVHHSVFPWELSPLIADVLLHPKKTPKYRMGRDHMSFLRSVREALDPVRDLSTMDMFEHALCESACAPLSSRFARRARVTVSVDCSHDGDICDSLSNSETLVSSAFVDEAVASLNSPSTILV